MTTSMHHDETIVIYRALRSQTGSLLVFFATLAAAVYLTARFDWSVENIDLGPWAGREVQMPVPLFGIVPLALLAKILHSLLNCRYIICDTYVLEVRGLWDLRRKSIRLNYIHIRGVEINASLWQQVLGISDLTILGPTMEPVAHSIEMKGIARARKVKDLINARIESHVKGVAATIV